MSSFPVQFFARVDLPAALATGWSPLVGHAYAPGEYAFLLCRDEAVRSAHDVDRVIAAICIPADAKRPYTKPRVSSKLTREIWTEIETRLSSGQRQHAIALAVGVAQSTVARVNAERRAA